MKIHILNAQWIGTLIVEGNHKPFCELACPLLVCRLWRIVAELFFDYDEYLLLASDVYGFSVSSFGAKGFLLHISVVVCHTFFQPDRKCLTLSPGEIVYFRKSPLSGDLVHSRRHNLYSGDQMRS